MSIIAEIAKLSEKYGTKEPYELCECMDIPIICSELPKSVNGFFTTIKKGDIIYINDELSEQVQKEVCAHELGHIILHPQCNLLFMLEKTLFVTEKYEREADEFAAALLIDDDEFENLAHMGQTVEGMAGILGISRKYMDIYVERICKIKGSV